MAALLEKLDAQKREKRAAASRGAETRPSPRSPPSRAGPAMGGDSPMAALLAKLDAKKRENKSPEPAAEAPQRRARKQREPRKATRSERTSRYDEPEPAPKPPARRSPSPVMDTEFDEVDARLAALEKEQKEKEQIKKLTARLKVLESKVTGYPKVKKENERLKAELKEKNAYFEKIKERCRVLKEQSENPRGRRRNEPDNRMRRDPPGRGPGRGPGQRYVYNDGLDRDRRDPRGIPADRFDRRGPPPRDFGRRDPYDDRGRGPPPRDFGRRDPYDDRGRGPPPRDFDRRYDDRGSTMRRPRRRDAYEGARERNFDQRRGWHAAMERKLVRRQEDRELRQKMREEQDRLAREAQLANLEEGEEPPPPRPRVSHWVAKHSDPDAYGGETELEECKKLGLQPFGALKPEEPAPAEPAATTV